MIDGAELEMHICARLRSLSRQWLLPIDVKGKVSSVEI
jgi:hypothetical protein